MAAGEKASDAQRLRSARVPVSLVRAVAATTVVFGVGAAAAVAQDSYQLRFVAVACVSRDVAETRLRLEVEGDSARARDALVERCFRVAAGTVLRLTRESSRNQSAWVEVYAADGSRLDEPVGGGEPALPMLRGWVRREWLDRVNETC